MTAPLVFASGKGNVTTVPLFQLALHQYVALMNLHDRLNDIADGVADVHTLAEIQGGYRGYRFAIRIESDWAKSSSV